jgi:hypothetical protein
MKRIIFTLAAFGSAVTGFGQSIVYDNSSTFLENNFPLLPAAYNNSAEAGDEVLLDGVDRNITELKLYFWYRGTVPGTIDARVRFLAVDGPGETPGTELYNSGIIEGLTTVSGMNEYRFAIPGVLVPYRMVWTIQVFNRQGSEGELGPAYFHPPTVGFSDDFFWLSDSGSPWTPYSWGGEPVANFGAVITAVPEPLTVVALVGGAALLLRRRRRS